MHRWVWYLNKYFQFYIMFYNKQIFPQTNQTANGIRLMRIAHIISQTTYINTYSIHDSICLTLLGNQKRFFKSVTIKSNYLLKDNFANGKKSKLFLKDVKNRDETTFASFKVYFILKVMLLNRLRLCEI